ncbi:hypothetical protein BVG16_14510 [Paenibacillus selenitireducens]|uniref:Uncharacterized protein n=1 Tax=Paenibacillus selenitireducens TaxID=1324314 RepID=A0A1T2XCL6_9BACL|nr:YlzJ-like family protein [Paenibacillus selenitireducens]OPA77654.1 hypothetical protein BVG16_14510 [Paenibacillus selenitireducens]
MTIYTSMPIELVLSGVEQPRQPDMELEVNGILMQVSPLGTTSGTIVRLLRCPLHTYLDPSYAPGQVIQYHPIIPSGTNSMFK